MDGLWDQPVRIYINHQPEKDAEVQNCKSEAFVWPPELVCLQCLQKSLEQGNTRHRFSSHGDLNTRADFLLSASSPKPHSCAVLERVGDREGTLSSQQISTS